MFCKQNMFLWFTYDFCNNNHLHMDSITTQLLTQLTAYGTSVLEWSWPVDGYWTIPTCSCNTWSASIMGGTSTQCTFQHCNSPQSVTHPTRIRRTDGATNRKCPHILEAERGVVNCGTVRMMPLAWVNANVFLDEYHVTKMMVWKRTKNWSFASVPVIKPNELTKVCANVCPTNEYNKLGAIRCSALYERQVMSIIL